MWIGFFLLLYQTQTPNPSPLVFSLDFGVFKPDFFEGCPGGKFPLAPFLLRAITKKQLTGEHFDGLWSDCGLIEHINALEHTLKQH